MALALRNVLASATAAAPPRAAPYLAAPAVAGRSRGAMACRAGPPKHTQQHGLVPSRGEGLKRDGAPAAVSKVPGVASGPPSSSSGLGALPPVQEVAKLIAGGVGLCLAAAAGGVWINTFSNPSCEAMHSCQPIPVYMKVPLIATHLFSFVLIPATMWVFWSRAKSLRAAGAQDPFVALVGLAFLAVAIAGEMGWHVTQEWFYKEEFSIMNMFFYFFLINGTALWAIGIKEDDTATDLDERLDAVLLSSPWLAGVVYLVGAAVTKTKVPIYILLSFEYAVLTRRFWKLLDTPLVLLFPLFSVGVNLGFIALLNQHQADPVLNPLFHILHDAAGTEAGVALIAALVYARLPRGEQDGS